MSNDYWRASDPVTRREHALRKYKKFEDYVASQFETELTVPRENLVVFTRCGWEGCEVDFEKWAAE